MNVGDINQHFLCGQVARNAGDTRSMQMSSYICNRVTIRKLANQIGNLVARFPADSTQTQLWL